MIEEDADLKRILAECATGDDLDFYVMKHALIVQHLVCHMAREANRTESSIRTLYAAWADMAVVQFKDPKAVSRRWLH